MRQAVAIRSRSALGVDSSLIGIQPRRRHDPLPSAMTTMQKLTTRSVAESPPEAGTWPVLVPINGTDPSITNRQRQVIQLICGGYRSKEIALQLGISPERWSITDTR